MASHPVSARSASSSVRPLSAIAEEGLVRLIQRKTGIVLQDHQLSTLRDTVKQACQHFDYHSVDELLMRLQADTSLLTPEMEFLIGGITVGESYFFRDQFQMDFLRHTWLPGVIREKRQRNDKSLRIWSAGCADGQELYSLAMLLAEDLPDLADWNVHLLGTDINTNALSRALGGRYTGWSLRATRDELQRKYFTRRGSEYIIRPELRAVTKFAYLNLGNDSFPSILTETVALDLILCRNVFIYFDQNAIAAVMHKFADCLAPDGILMLGASDNVARTPDSLAFIHKNDVFYYRRSDTKASAASPLPARRPLSALMMPVAPAALPPVSTETACPASSRAIQAVQTAAIEQARETIFNLIRTERWRDVVGAADNALQQHGERPDLLQCKAKALANLGELAAALALCERCLRLDATDKHTYLIQALVLTELNEPGAAQAALRKALFLDSGMVEAHFHLGLLFLRGGQRKKGIKSLRNALALTEASDPERRIHNTQDMTFGRFGVILRNEISIYENA